VFRREARFLPTVPKSIALSYAALTFDGRAHALQSFGCGARVTRAVELPNEPRRVA
jgi:hypothetical protein